MKKTIAVLLALATMAVFAGADDLLITFSTPGPDKYADGKTVLDNECYSLVYTKADGTQTKVITVPAAKGGKCIPVLFVLSASEAASFTGGEWGVFLLDTRDFAKDAAGETLSTIGADGQPAVVNVSAAVTKEIAISDGIASASAKEAVSAASFDLGAAGVPTPKVTGIQVVGANVVVTVENTVPFVGYTLQAGNDVTKAFAVPKGAIPSSGDANGEIELVTPKTDGAQFFKVSTIK